MPVFRDDPQPKPKRAKVLSKPLRPSKKDYRLKPRNPAKGKRP